MLNNVVYSKLVVGARQCEFDATQVQARTRETAAASFSVRNAKV